MPWSSTPLTTVPGSGSVTGLAADSLGRLYATLSVDTTFQRYDPAANAWTALAAAPASVLRLVHSTDGYIYATGSGSSAFFARYDPASNAWSSRASLPAAADWGIAAGPDGTILAHDTTNSTVAVYDPASDTWTQRAESLPNPASNVNRAVGYFDSRIVVAGGYISTGVTDKVQSYAYPLGSGAASGSHAVLPTTSDRGAVAVVNGRLYYLTGRVGTGNNGWRLYKSGATLADLWTREEDGPFVDTDLDYPVVTSDGQTLYVVQNTSNVTGSTLRGVYTYTPNVAPNAPTLTTLAGGEVIDRAVANRAAHEFSDANTGDSQSAFDLRYRLEGAASWTEVYQATPNQWHDFPAGSLAAGNYERQVRTYDSQGVVGPWSASGFFTAADKPTGLTITDPVNGSTIPTNTVTVTWSAPNQDAYQAQVLDGATVEHDTGTVESPTTRSRDVPLPVNNAGRTIGVRVRNAGLWSDWYTITVTVSYTPPPTPTSTLSVDAASGSLVVQVTNPAPGAGEPAVSYNDVYVTEPVNGVAVEQRRATGLPPNTAWRYWTPISGRDYGASVRVVAVASNGTTASSI